MNAGTSSLCAEALGHAYLDAKEYVLCSGFGEEIDSLDDASLEELSETIFLREYAWVVLATGLADRVVRKFHGRICDAFFGFASASAIVANQRECFDAAISEFRHLGKIRAIVSTCGVIDEIGFETFRDALMSEGPDFLVNLPYIGAVNSRHLAKNVGIDIAKSDRHLVRIASELEFESVNEMCAVIADLIGDRVSTIDSVLWRFATLRSDYKSFLSKTARSTLGEGNGHSLVRDSRSCARAVTCPTSRSPKR